MSSFVPDSEDCFGFWCEASIGRSDGEGADLFQFCVCTPAWLIEERRRGLIDEVSLLRGLILVFSYDYEAVVNLVQAYARSCEGKTWGEIAAKLSRVGLWEFEDYQPYIERHS